MSNFKVMNFVRETRDKIYEDTKNKSSDEIKKYYKEKASWLKPLLKKNISNDIKKKRAARKK